MDVHDHRVGLRDALDGSAPQTVRVGLVPTMGYLHDGHVSLMRGRRRVRRRGGDDLREPAAVRRERGPLGLPARPPRDLALRARGVTHVFTPSITEMYPEPAVTTVSVAALAASMEGASRPTHFAGVATVVAKLFNIAGPCRAYFGEKDFQQLAVVRRMARDLDFPVEVVGCPIVREPDGLAMSSRNVYLTPAERQAAPGAPPGPPGRCGRDPGRRARCRTRSAARWATSSTPSPLD